MSGQRESRTAGTWLPVAAILLLILGILLLLTTTGVVGQGIWPILFDLWPLILIAVGLNIILASRFPVISAIVVALVLAAGAAGAYLASWDTAFDDDRSYQYGISSNQPEFLELDVNFGAGSLVVDSIESPNEGEMIMAHFNGLGAYADDRITENGLEVTLSMDTPGLRLNSGDDGWQPEIILSGLLGVLTDSEWDVEVSPDIAQIVMDIEGGAADMDLRLADLNVKTLDMDIGAAGVDIALPANAGHTDVYIDAGDADIDITVPDGVAALIESDSAMSSLDVNTTRFPDNGGMYQSPDYATAQNRVYIRIDAGVSNISVN